MLVSFCSVSDDWLKSAARISITDSGGVFDELRAVAPDNVWICEIGDVAQSGSFDDFIHAITSANLMIEGLNVRYASPSAGALAFGWRAPLTVDGEPVEVHAYERFDNPYCQATFGARKLTIAHAGESITLDFDS